MGKKKKNRSMKGSVAEGPINEVHHPSFRSSFFPLITTLQPISFLIKIYSGHASPNVMDTHQKFCKTKDKNKREREREKTLLSPVIQSDQHDR